MVEQLSLTSNFIEILYVNDGLTKLISTATGFIIDLPDGRFLVTNWHVVTGKDAITQENLSSTAAIPNTLKIWIQKKQSTNYEGVPITVPLYLKDNDYP